MMNIYLWILQPFSEVHGPGTKDTKNYMSVNQEVLVKVKNNGHR